LHIVVCIKQIFDPEVATTVFRIDEEGRKIIPLSGVAPVISPFDEQAVEAALRIKDDLGDEIKITVITMGPESARAVLKAGLAKGADEGVLLMDAAFEESDAFTTARTLAAAIQKIGDVDLIIAGRQAADGDLGVVGLGVAELLCLPAITSWVSPAIPVCARPCAQRANRFMCGALEIWTLTHKKLAPPAHGASWSGSISRSQTSNANS
jgi:electron transfer flavoprotein beta subunit